tara:strand:+ start:3608 stop:4678 length:1071 start_codon:yes stop_codon:yes gene_type:complete
MSIVGYTKLEFVGRLNAHLSASGPVRSIEHLFGRERELEGIEEALYANGRHVFVFGDRGAGKSSLAAAAAAQYQSPDNAPIQIGCGADSTFYQIIEELADSVIKKANGTRRHHVSHTLDLRLYRVQVKGQDKEVTVPRVDSLFNAVEAVESVARYHSEAPVVVLDEFDQIPAEEERKRFAHFLKSLGDRGVNIKFIFTGVASSVTKLLGDHESSFRQLHTIHLDRLNWSAREEIVIKAANAFGLAVDPEVNFSIAKISNGFPYYVHLMMEKLLWCAFNSEEPIHSLGHDLYNRALQDSIDSIEAQLQRPYKAATLHRNPDFREVVWATADSESLIRTTDNIFKSYLRVHEQLFGPV